jgi:hypothetical protein
LFFTLQNFFLKIWRVWWIGANGKTAFSRQGAIFECF